MWNSEQRPDVSQPKGNEVNIGHNGLPTERFVSWQVLRPRQNKTKQNTDHLC